MIRVRMLELYLKEPDANRFRNASFIRTEHVMQTSKTFVHVLCVRETEMTVIICRHSFHHGAGERNLRFRPA